MIYKSLGASYTKNLNRTAKISYMSGYLCLRTGQPKSVTCQVTCTLGRLTLDNKWCLKEKEEITSKLGHEITSITILGHDITSILGHEITRILGHEITLPGYWDMKLPVYWNWAMKLPEYWTSWAKAIKTIYLFLIVDLILRVNIYKVAP